MDRKLAAILAADVVGSSRLMEADEETAVRELHAHRATITGFVESHQGRVFGGAGDSLVAEFASAVGAVRCALAIQTEIEQRNQDVPAERKMLFRIGINLGDVIIDADDLMGDGVNVAARLEGLAPAGGITVSESIYQQIGGKIEIPFEDAGEYHVKNIERPIRVWRWPARVLPGQRTPNRSSAGANSPSVAVLPFINMSGDTEQEYFSDGITEDIITDLSKISGMFVPARNSSFQYKGTTVVPEEVAQLDRRPPPLVAFRKPVRNTPRWQLQAAGPEFKAAAAIQA